MGFESTNHRKKTIVDVSVQFAVIIHHIEQFIAHAGSSVPKDEEYQNVEGTSLV